MVTHSLLMALVLLPTRTGRSPVRRGVNHLNVDPLDLIHRIRRHTTWINITPAANVTSVVRVTTPLIVVTTAFVTCWSCGLLGHKNTMCRKWWTKHSAPDIWLVVREPRGFYCFLVQLFGQLFPLGKCLRNSNLELLQTQRWQFFSSRP